MKLRKIGTLFLLVAMTAILAVACNSEVADGSVANADPGKELVYATFGNSSKAIAVDSVVGYKTYGELYWFYTAEKMDDYGRTGQQLSPVPVKGQGETEHTPGLDGKEVGPFSQGVWSFTLYAYDNADKTTLYYEGTNTSVELRANQQNNIPVTVEPQGTTGKISFKDAWYEWDSFGTAAVNLTITLTSSDNTVYNCTTKTLEKSGDKYPITGYITYGEPTALIDSFPAGIYTAQFKVVSIPANANSEPYEFVSQPLAFRVYGNLETQLTGNLVEGLFATGYFTVPEQQINVFNAAVVGEVVQEVKQEVAIAPAKTEQGANQTTNITFPSGSITSEQHSLKVEVTNMADAASKFEVETGDDTAVAGIDLQLMKITTTDTTTTEVPVTDFVKDRGESTEEIHYVTIETYIAKGFNAVTVVYNGNTYTDQPVANNGATSSNEADVYATDALMGATNLGYSQESGKLRFKTTHFSEFYVKSDVQAFNVTTNTVYISLTAAVEGASAGDEIRLLKNVELSDQLWIGKKLTLDLNGKTVSLNMEDRHKNGVIGVLRGGDVTIKDSGTDGIIDATIGKGAYAGVGLTRTDDGETGEKAKLTVDSGTIKGYYYGISGNGTRHNTEIVINGGTITSPSDQGLGIYHPQDGTLIITGGKISGYDSAVELRAGTANVTGGTFTATKTPTEYVSNGSGTTTSGVAFAVAQHTTQKAIDVKISGGSFTGNTAFSYMNPESNATTNTSVVISGGTFTSTATGSAVAVESVYTEFLKGGTYNVKPELKYIKKGYEAVPASSTGPWTVQEVSPVDAVVKLIDTNENVYFYNNLQTAFDVASDGDTVVLLKGTVSKNGNFVLNSDTTKNLVFDLNGFTLNAGLDIYNVALEIKNGNIAKTIHLNGNNTTAEYLSKLTIATDATVSGRYAVILWGTGTANDMVLDVYGTVNDVVWVMGNITAGNSAINIYPSATMHNSRSESLCIANQGYVTTTIYGGELIGDGSAIEARSGVVNIQGGTFTSTYNGATESHPASSGTTTIGAAVAFAPYGNSSLTVNIYDGTFNGSTAVYLTNPNKVGTTPENTFIISGGTFTGTYTDNIAVNDSGNLEEFLSPSSGITGGKYSSDPTAYVADGYHAEYNEENKTWTVLEGLVGGGDSMTGWEEDDM